LPGRFIGRLDQADEDVLERALRRVQVLKPMPAAFSPEQRRDAGPLALRVS
jgi:hypothetical protein